MNTPPRARGAAAADARQLSLFVAEDWAVDPAVLDVAPGTAAHAAEPELGPCVHPRTSRSLELMGQRIGYELRRRRRRSIGFSVGPEGLSVSAPRWVSIAEVEGALREKAVWILRKLQEQQRRALQIAQARVQWRDGTTLPFLGQAVVVMVDPLVSGAVLDASVQARPGAPHATLRVGLPKSCTPSQLREAVQGWLQRQARRVFEERCAVFAERLQVRMRRLSLSSAATRWGSASADGSIRLNWRLVHFAQPVIDYVVVHELAHLREMNHSAAFWDMVKSVVPDYPSARQTLDTEVLPVFD